MGLSPHQRRQRPLEWRYAMRTHLRIAAALLLFAGGVLTVSAMLAPWLFDAFAATIRESPDEGAELGAAALGLTGRLLSVISAVFAVSCLACGWGILKRKRWSRIAGSALAAIFLLYLPVGTIVGAYLLWVLLSTRSEPWFDGEEEPGQVRS